MHCSIRNVATLTAFAVVSVVSQSSGQVTIAKWTFETSPPTDVTDQASITGLTADIGTGTASGVHASGLTDWTTPAGNGSANSLSSNRWGINDYYQFQVSTAGLSGITVKWAQTRSSTGPETFDLQYSVNGVDFFTALDDYAVGTTDWLSATSPEFDEDLSSISLLNDSSAVYFRLVAVSSAGGVGGTNRVDDFSVLAAVPEPATYAAVLGLVSLGIVLWRRRRAVA